MATTTSVVPALAPLPKKGRRTRVPVPLSENLENQLKEYIAFYTSVHGEEPKIGTIMGAICEQFIAADQAFKKWVRQQGKKEDA